jgi:predicted ATPase/DNA-binding SARP family transcriptional activator
MPTLESAVAPLTIELFGPFTVYVEGRPLPRLRSRKGQWLLALLALRGGREVQRAWLAGTLWPDSPEEQAFASLRQSLSDLRKALGTQAHRLQSPTPQTVLLDLTGAQADVLAFDRAVTGQDREALEVVVALYRGPLLEGCPEEWVVQERIVREQAFLQSLEKLAAAHREAGDPVAAAGYLRRAIAVDPLSESLHGALMEALAAAGDYAEAIQVYRDLRRLLRQEMRVEPAQETQATLQRIKAEARRKGQHTAVLLPETPSAPPPRSIPRPLTPLIGREAERDVVQGCLGQHRLVTLTGAGGVGKTRLAIQIAEDMADDYPDGAWFVELAALDRPELLVPTVATTLNVREEPGRSLSAALTETLRARTLLLVLDNCEHLLEACARLVEGLLRNCPALRILTTTRQPLGLTGEITQRVPSLSLPVGEAADRLAPEQLLQYEAVRLFVERASAATGTFALSERNALAVVQLCRRLDGIPLALELAAARTKSLSVEQITARLDDRFRLLTGGSRSALPRQQTLKALLDWSYDLLTAPERSLLNRLSVFAGGWNLEAAEAVCSDDRRMMREDVLDLLAQLVDKSLVMYEPKDGEGRYRLLETVAQYSRDRLREQGETETFRERHAAYFLARAQEWSGQLSGGPEAASALQAFVADIENARRGMDWAVEQGANARIVDYGKALFGFLRMRGLYDECESRLERACEAARQSRDAVSLARLLNQRGLVAWERFRLEAARALFTESYEISERLGDKTRMLSALINLGNICWGRSDYAEAERIYATALPLAIETKQTSYEAALRLNLGILSIERDEIAEAERHLAASLEMYQRLQNEEYIGHTLYNFSELYRRQGAYAWALEYAEESLRRFTALGHRRGITLAEVRIALNLLEDGRTEEARSHLERGLQIAQEIGDRAGEMYALEVEARMAADDLARAKALFRRSYEIARAVGDRKQIAQVLAHYGDALLSAEGPEAACQLWSLAEREYTACALNQRALSARLQAYRATLTPESVAHLESRLTALTPETVFQ